MCHMLRVTYCRRVTDFTDKSSRYSRTNKVTVNVSLGFQWNYDPGTELYIVCLKSNETGCIKLCDTFTIPQLPPRKEVIPID